MSGRAFCAWINGKIDGLNADGQSILLSQSLIHCSSNDAPRNNATRMNVITLKIITCHNSQTADKTNSGDEGLGFTAYKLRRRIRLKKPEDQLMLALIGRVVDHLFHLVRVAIRNRRQNLKISLHINVRHQQNLIVFPMPRNNSVIWM